MKEWSKIEYALLRDERIQMLINDYGLKALGVYLILRLMVDCCEGGEALVEPLVRSANAYTGRRLIMHVLEDYDLFEKEGSRIHVRTQGTKRGHKQGRTDSLACTPACPPADEHIPLSCKLEKEYYYYSKEEGKKEGAAHTLDDVRQWLMDEKNLVWRESMLMNCGYAELLSSKWPEAVEYFVTHIQAQDVQDSINTPHDAKYYFTNFSRINTASGRSLKQHLEQLEQKTLTNEQIRRALGYEDPPPLPPPVK